MRLEKCKKQFSGDHKEDAKIDYEKPDIVSEIDRIFGPFFENQERSAECGKIHQLAFALNEKVQPEKTITQYLLRICRELKTESKKFSNDSELLEKLRKSIDEFKKNLHEDVKGIVEILIEIHIEIQLSLLDNEKFKFQEVLSEIINSLINNGKKLAIWEHLKGLFDEYMEDEKKIKEEIALIEEQITQFKKLIKDISDEIVKKDFEGLLLRLQWILKEPCERSVSHNEIEKKLTELRSKVGSDTELRESEDMVNHYRLAQTFISRLSEERLFIVNRFSEIIIAETQQLGKRLDEIEKTSVTDVSELNSAPKAPQALFQPKSVQQNQDIDPLPKEEGSGMKILGNQQF